jgi:hypothetical protein
MQPILNHLDNIVRPAVRDYVAAESALDAAHIAKDANAIDAARKNVMRRARIATTELHHLQDFVLHNPQPGLSFARIEDIRSALRVHASSAEERLLSAIRICCGTRPTHSSTT